jgi:hypothetical protein
MINKAVIFAGAVGGVAPNFLRLIVNYSSPSPQRIMPDGQIGYWLAVVGFGLLGALVVWIFQEAELKRAFYVGIGLPSLLQVTTLTWAQSPHQYTVAPPPAGVETSISLISSAYAQEGPPAEVSAPGRKLKLTGATNAPQLSVSFYGADEKWIPPTTPATQEVAVPPTAAKFAIQVGRSISPSYPIPATPGAVINAKVKISPKAGSGFLQGVGLGKAYDITVQVAPTTR